jgi:hypothetical protein
VTLKSVDPALGTGLALARAILNVGDLVREGKVRFFGLPERDCPLLGNVQSEPLAD